MSDPRAKEIVDGLGDAAPGEADRHASQVMVDALRAHRGRLAGEAAIPEHDRVLSSKIMAEARTRSQEIRQVASARPADRPIPWWLWLAWLAAAGGLVFLWFWLK